MIAGIVLVILLFAFLFASIGREFYRRQERHNRVCARHERQDIAWWTWLVRAVARRGRYTALLLIFIAGCGETPRSVVVTPPPPNVVAAPTFTPSPGPALLGQAVAIASATQNAEILYSTDGTQPSIPYSQPLPLTVNGTFTVKATASAGGVTSAVVTANYTVSQATNSSGFVQVQWATCGFAVVNLNCVSGNNAVGASDAGSTTSITQPCITIQNPNDLLLIFTVSTPLTSYNWAGASANPPTAGYPGVDTFDISGHVGTPYSNADTLATTQTSTTQPWLVLEDSVVGASGTECVSLEFNNLVPPHTIAQIGIWLVEYTAPGTDNPSIGARWNAPVANNAITNEIFTSSAEPVVSFGLANGSTILAGNGATSRLSILDSTGILFQDESVGAGGAAPQMFVNEQPSASFILSIGLEPQQ